MKVIIPLAREGRELSENYTHLIEIAGKSVLGHLIDQALQVKPDEIIFIVSDHEHSLIKYVKTTCKVPFRFIKQKALKGSAHAIYGAKRFCQGEILVLFGDSLIDNESLKVDKSSCDGMIWVKEVSDPRQLGVVFMDGQYASRLIEKPDEIISTLAMTGAYYFKDSSQLFSMIKRMFDNAILTKGKYHLTDAIQLMISNLNARIRTAQTKVWFNVDSLEGLLGVNEFLCKKRSFSAGKVKNSVIIQPVCIDKDAVIIDSVIGPCVSIASGCRVSRSIVFQSIVAKEASVADASIGKSIVGHKSSVRGHIHHVNVADHSTARFE